MAPYALCGKLVAVAGQRDALAGHLLDAASSLQAVEGCRLYLVNNALDDPDGVWVVEVWDSARAHRSSLELPAVQELIAKARPIIADMPTRIEMEPVGGKGLGVAG